MDPTPGCSSDQSGETNTVTGKIEYILENLDDILCVRHGFFKWSVEKFSTFPEGRGISCSSPNFVLGETWWYLKLCPHANANGRDGISMALVRCINDLGPENAVASYALGLENSSSKVWFKSEENIPFKKGNHHELQTSVLGNLQQNFMSENAVNDTLSVVCDIYVAYLSDKEHKSGGRISQIDQTLSSEIAELFSSQKQVDVLIEVRDHSVRAHKSILSARSRTLARLLENGKSCIQLSCTESCLTCVLLYMYSGSLSYLARNDAVFNVGLYELACELELDYLKDMLVPHKIEKESKVKVRCFQRTCTIYRFEMAELSRRNIESDKGFDEESGMSAKLTLYRMDSISESMGINIEVDGVGGMFFVELSVSLLNKNCEPFRVVKANVLPDPQPEIKDSTLFTSLFVSNADVLSSVNNGNLFINVKCTKYYLKNVSAILCSVNPLPKDSKIWIEGLSSDLQKLYETEKLSDITLILETVQRFKVHRSILSARTSIFYNLFCKRNYDGNAVDVRSTERRILQLILTFIYSGKIGDVNNLTREDFSKMLGVSLTWDIPSMVDLCTQFLKTTLENQLPSTLSN